MICKFVADFSGRGSLYCNFNNVTNFLRGLENLVSLVLLPY